MTRAEQVARRWISADDPDSSLTKGLQEQFTLIGSLLEWTLYASVVGQWLARVLD